MTAPDLAPPPPLAPDAALYLDFDGTLVEIVDRPDAIVVDAPLRDLLARLFDRLDGRVALVSGRSAAQLAGFFGGPLPVAASGSHGSEFAWPDGRSETPDRPAALDRASAAFHAFAADREGVLVEDKALGVGLHYRLAPGAEEACRALAERWAGDIGLVLQRGKMLCELRVAGDKGAAIRRMAAQVPMAGHRPIFVGDDVTDEDGFAAAAALGGWGVLVGPARATAARHRLLDVAAVRAWLATAA